MEGYSAIQLLSQLHDRVVVMETLTDKQKSIIVQRMAVSNSMIECKFVCYSS